MNDQYRKVGVEQLNSRINQLNNLIDKGNFSRSDLDEIHQAIKQLYESETENDVKKRVKE